MNRCLIFFVLLFSFLTVSAQELKWHTDINEAIKISVKEKKPMFLFFTGSDWCGWCIKLQNEVFNKPEFILWSKKVVLVELDYPKRTPQADLVKQQNQNLQQMFSVNGFPTVWFVKAEIKLDKSINLLQLGRTGYLAGGPTTWLANANQFIGK